MDRKEILENAIKHTCGDRDIEYGNPVDNMQHTANLWSAYTGYPLDADDVAIMLSLLKICRMKGKVRADTFEDACAYIAIAGECKNEL